MVARLGLADRPLMFTWGGAGQPWPRVVLSPEQARTWLRESAEQGYTRVRLSIEAHDGTVYVHMWPVLQEGAIRDP